MIWKGGSGGGGGHTESGREEIRRSHGVGDSEVVKGNLTGHLGFPLICYKRVQQ